MLEANEAAQRDLIEEVRQLVAQYLAEVPSRRRTWPRSIKERVLQLLKLEMACEAAGRATGIPAATIYGWKAAAGPSGMEARPAFLPVQIVRDAPPLPASLNRPEEKRRGSYRQDRKKKSTVHSPTLIVMTAPNGLRIEGLDPRTAIEIARLLGLVTNP